MKANTAQRLQAQTASPQYVNNKLFRQTLFGAHPYARIGVTPDTLPAIDRPSIVGVSTNLLPAQQRRSHRGRRRCRRRGVCGGGTGVRQLGAPRLPEAKPAAMPALKGRTLVFVQRPNSVQSSISVGNFTPERDDPRWYTLQLANQIFGAAFDSRLVQEHPRGEGLHLLAAVDFPVDGAGRLVSRRRRCAERCHRRDVEGDLRRDRQAAQPAVPKPRS